jgi:hypothetical protein
VGTKLCVKQLNCVPPGGSHDRRGSDSCFQNQSMFKRTSSSPNLQSTSADNGGALLVLDAARLGADGLKSGDDIHGGLVSDLAEDDVAAIEPRGDDGGDEELRAVARRR